MDDPAGYGEIGGIFAGIVALLATIGGGIKWSLNWTDRRATTRAAKLDAWQKELALKEQRLDEEQSQFNAEVRQQLASLTERYDQMHREHAALLGGYQLIAAELRARDPDNHVLRMADELLRSAFPLDPTMPGNMAALLAIAKRSDEQ